MKFLEKSLPLLLDVWAEACRHIEIAESAATISVMLRRHLPIRSLIVRRLDRARGCVETVAACHVGKAAKGGEQRTGCDTATVSGLLGHSGRVLRNSGKTDRAIAALIPAGLEGDLLVGLLRTEGQVTGALVLAADAGRPFTPAHEAIVKALLEPFSVALENDRRLHEMRALREAAEADKRSLLARLGRTDLTDDIVGVDSGLRQVMDRVNLVAPSGAPVLILGETGVGKELIARAIRNGSDRANGPFIRVNCGSIPPELMDSELFGHERGGFTGAVSARKGWFERADKGTLLLDEIGELPVAAQVRLLRVLQEGMFERVGGHETVHVDVRIIAATNRDLAAMVREGAFREDLYYRIAVFPILVPPLRDRPQDVALLAAHFARRAATRFSLPLCLPTADDIARLQAYAWPGNIRELGAVIDRAAILGNGHHLDIAVALGVPGGPSVTRRVFGPSAMTESAAGAPMPLEAAMRQHIEEALVKARGRVEGPFGAAALLGINPHTLRSRMRKVGIDWKAFRSQAGSPLPARYVSGA